MLSGKTLWRLTCGAFADTKAVGLTAECKGAPTVRGQGHYGGMWGQKQKLLKNLHPRLGTSLPYPIYEDGTLVHSTGRYPNLPANRTASALRQDQTPLLGDVIGTNKRRHLPAQGKTAQQKMQEMLERIRVKERLARRRDISECGRSHRCSGRRYRPRGKQSVKASVDTVFGRDDLGGGIWEWAFSDEAR